MNRRIIAGAYPAAILGLILVLGSLIHAELAPSRRFSQISSPDSVTVGAAAPRALSISRDGRDVSEHAATRPEPRASETSAVIAADDHGAPAGTPLSIMDRAQADCDTFVEQLGERGVPAHLVSWRIVDRFVMTKQSGYALVCRVVHGEGEQQRVDEAGVIVYDGTAPSAAFIAGVGEGPQMATLPAVVRLRSAEVCENFAALVRRDIGVSLTLLSWRVAGSYRQLSVTGYFLGCRVYVPGLGTREMVYVTKYRAGELAAVVPDPY